MKKIPRYLMILLLLPALLHTLGGCVADPIAANASEDEVKTDFDQWKEEEYSGTQIAGNDTNKNTVAKSQIVLKQLGYDVGEVDGIMGTKTKSAIKQFQKDNQLEEDGKLESFMSQFPQLTETK
jgi:peptidoglycan hydrolase-like protein with peptidoglycan-binding domain